ncbi:Rv3654c family TadE-like protein [Nocardioides sp. GCM10027113]|uniref:Rv3654c family TadE-like protein n=1 Tax=unclassified Nocardioides TaxID=2615069 RepID=UPI0036102A58
MSRERRHPEHGSATLAATTFLAVLLLLGVALGTVAAMVRAHHVAESAADLSALAGAVALRDGGAACPAAARVAAANGAELTDCRSAGAVVEVTVTVTGPSWPGGLGPGADLAARARAGPG